MNPPPTLEPTVLFAVAYRGTERSRKFRPVLSDHPLLMKPFWPSHEAMLKQCDPMLRAVIAPEGGLNA